MIKLDRRPRKPALFESQKFQNFIDALWSFHSAGGTRAKQKWFSWQEQFEPFQADAMAALHTYFRGKCAYTEANLTDDRGGLVDHARFVLHRPASDAIGTDGSISPDHYWWLIPFWSNWYLASGSVASVKENRFPVDGQRMAVPEKRRPSYPIDERSLLLDPCRDDPVWFLRFWRTGAVGACDVETGTSWPSRRLPSDLPHPGIHTIRTLDLNNETLVEERRRVARATMGRISRLLKGGSEDTDVLSAVSRNQPFAAAARQAAALFLISQLDAKRGGDFSKPSIREIIRPLVDELASEMAVTIICAPRKLQSLAPFAQVILEPIADSEGLTQRPEARKQFLLALRAGRLKKTATPPAARTEKQIPESPPKAGAEKTAEPLPEPERPVIDRSAHVRYILIKNFKAIQEVELDTSDLDEDERTVTLEPAWKEEEQEEHIRDARRWWTFLGENGSGKSCILQAIGLALAGEHIETVMSEAGLDWKDLLRRPPEGCEENVSRGRICLEFTNGVRIDLRFSDRSHWWMKDMRDLGEEATDLPPRSGLPDIQTFIRGYGATRLLESEDSPFGKASGARVEMPTNLRIANLFDPRACVIDAEKWLLGLSGADFNVAAPTIANLLEDRRRMAQPSPSKRAAATAEPEPILTRTKERVMVDGLPLNLVSDGYRAIVAMLCDIMSGLGEGVSKMREAPGIVLIDEIGSHLHPRWRMAITRKLRRALPRVQFIISTHEPLCLRGLVSKEVVRVHKHPQHGVISELIERSPSTYRVDQLLTSEFFGLDTTIDLDLENRFFHYYRLRAVPEKKRTEEQETEFRQLRRYLYEHARPSFGFTRRDQLVCDQIDDLLSEEYKEPPPLQSREAYINERLERRRATIARVRDIWNLRTAAHDLGGEP